MQMSPKRGRQCWCPHQLGHPCPHTERDGAGPQQLCCAVLSLHQDFVPKALITSTCQGCLTSSLMWWAQRVPGAEQGCPRAQGKQKGGTALVWLQPVELEHLHDPGGPSEGCSQFITAAEAVPGALARHLQHSPSWLCQATAAPQPPPATASSPCSALTHSCVMWLLILSLSRHTQRQLHKPQQHQQPAPSPCSCPFHYWHREQTAHISLHQD